MIRAIVWKEFREQGLIGLTLLVLGAGILVAAAAVADPPAPGAAPADVLRFLGAGLLATLLLAVTAGMVCGGALFAAEREAGTIGFLEALPVSRWQIWRAKVAAGSALVVIQVGAVVGVAAALGLIPTRGWAFAITVYALLAFVWGLYGSTLARTTLGSVGLAIPSASVAAFTFLFPIMLVFHSHRTNLPRPEGALIFLVLMFLTPLVASALAFTRPDRDRAADDPTPRPLPPARHPTDDPREPVSPADDYDDPAPARSRVGLKALVWLSARQLLRPGMVCSAFALVGGLALLLPTLDPVLVWPLVALSAGVIAGVTLFVDEQSSGTARFWGERRLPVGRAWAVKVAVHAAFALWLAVLLALPSAVRSQVGGGVRAETALGTVFRSLLFEERNLGAQGWKYLLAPLAYGFAAGHLCGLLFRKAVVATGVAGLVGGTAAALWGPSLLAGGVWHWQLWLPVVVMLATARLLLRAWSADRLTNPAPLATLAVGVAVALLVLAAGIGYRVVEVPANRGGEDDLRYVNHGLIPFDANAAGRDFRTAAEQFAKVASQATTEFERSGVIAGGRRGRVEEQVDRVLLGPGYAWDEPELHRWLTRVYQIEAVPPGGQEVPWHKLAAEAVRKDTGVFEHPTITGSAAEKTTLDNGRRMALVLLAHGLQRQVDGDPAAFVDDLRTAFALGRSMRNGSILASLARGNNVTWAALVGVDRWLERLDGRTDLLRQALDAVLEDERALLTRVLPDGRVLPAETPPPDRAAPFEFDPTPHLLAERYVVRELMKAPTQWLPDLITPAGGNKDAAAPVADLVGFAWSVPWERERTRRLVGLGFEPGRGADYQRLARGRPGAALLAFPASGPAELTEADRQVRVMRRVAAVKLAVRLHLAKTGSPPADLATLVAASYLPDVPADPYGDGPLRYRVSTGETLGPPPRSGGGPGPGPFGGGPRTLTVPDGQPIVWSVGPNRQDDGGRSMPALPTNPTRAEDLVFLVPPPPAPR